MIQQQTINGEQIIPGAHGSALVASVSAPGGWHRVAYGQCDCAGYQYRGHCRHLAAVASYYGLDRDERDCPDYPDSSRAGCRHLQARAAVSNAGEYMSVGEYLARREKGQME